MKIFLILSIAVFNSFCIANTDDKIVIRGSIGTDIQLKKVEIVDKYDQHMYLPKKEFPENFKFVTGTEFTLNISENLYESLEIYKLALSQ